jgi:hypothetical protein
MPQCLPKARDAGADKWSWFVLAESFFRLSDFRDYVKHELKDTDRPVSEYALKARANGPAASFINKFRELF